MPDPREYQSGLAHAEQNWDRAVRLVREAWTCPKCHASNRPGATIIEAVDHGLLYCGVCAHHWPAG